MMAQSDTGASDFQVGFLDLEGATIQSISVHADSVSIATSHAAKIATELNAVDFFITATPTIPASRGTSAPARIAKLIAFLHRPSFANVDAPTPPAGICP